MPPSPQKQDAASVRSCDTSSSDVISSPSEVTSTCVGDVIPDEQSTSQVPFESVQDTSSSDVSSGEGSPSRRHFESAKVTMTSGEEPASSHLGQCDSRVPPTCAPETTDGAKDSQDDELSPAKTLQVSQNSRAENFRSVGPERGLWNGEFSLDVPPSQRAVLLTADRYLRETEAQDGGYQDRLVRAMEATQRQLRPSTSKTQIYQFTTILPPRSGPRVKGDGAKPKLSQFTTVLPPRRGSGFKGQTHGSKQLQYAPTGPQGQVFVEAGWRREGSLDGTGSSSDDSEDCSSSDDGDKQGLIGDEEDTTCCGDDVSRKTKRRRLGRRGVEERIMTPCCNEFIIVGLLVFLSLGVLLLRYLLFPVQDT